jgi:hypothetical protein
MGMGGAFVGAGRIDFGGSRKLWCWDAGRSNSVTHSRNFVWDAQEVGSHRKRISLDSSPYLSLINSFRIARLRANPIYQFHPMGKQFNKVIKRRRRKLYLKRKSQRLKDAVANPSGDGTSKKSAPKAAVAKKSAPAAKKAAAKKSTAKKAATKKAVAEEVVAPEAAPATPEVETSAETSAKTSAE